MNRLADELLLRVLCLLDGADRVRCERVSRKWRAVSIGTWSEVRYVHLELKRIVTNCHYVGRIKFSLPALCAVMRRCAPNLRQLILRRLVNDETSAEAMRVLSDCVCGFASLEHLEMSDCTFEQDAVPQIMQHVTQMIQLASLKTLILDGNVQLLGHHSQFVGSLPLCSCLCNISALQALHLEETAINSRTFISLCRNLAPTLRKFCFKTENCEVGTKALSTGLSCLTALEELNLGGRRPQTRPVCSLITDQMLVSLSSKLCNLQKVSLRAGSTFTHRGVVALLSNCVFLTHIDISRCQKVGNAIGAYLRDRSDAQPLIVFAYLSSVDPSSIGVLPSNIEIITEAQSMDGSVFWGEKKPLALEQSWFDDGEDDDSFTSVDSYDSENWDW